MSERFPSGDLFRDFQEPGRFEAEVYDLEIEGQLPAQLRGNYYRLTPDPAWPPRHEHPIQFDGDGAMSLFRISAEGVNFRHRYVQTERYLAEQRARRALFGAYRNPYTDDPSVAGVDRSVANTTPLWYRQRLFALKEDGLPMELDPHSLATLGRHDFDGQYRCPHFTAHPKIDPRNGDLHCYGFAARGAGTSDIAYYCFDRNGQKVSERWFCAPYASMVHDFAVTPNYLVFIIVPYISDMERLRTGAPFFMWDPQQPSYVGVLPRHAAGAGGVDEPRWFRGPARYSAHVFNAHEQGQRILLDHPCAAGNALPFFPDVSGARPRLDQCAPRITRWSLDLASGGDQIAEQKLAQWPCEFPGIDQRFLMQAQRYGFAACQDAGKPWRGRSVPQRPLLGLNCALRHDFLSGESALWYAGEASLVEEPLFVARDPKAAEGDGFLLLLVNRFDERRSDLVILDAQRFDAAPLAIARLPFRLRSGLHGCWVPERELPAARAAAATRP